MEAEAAADGAAAPGGAGTGAGGAQERLAARFEERRGHLLAIAYRMLGSSGDAEDAVQETWLRLSRAGDAGVVDLTAWLRTVVSRVCLDLLRSRAARREDPAGEELPEHAGRPARPGDPGPPGDAGTAGGEPEDEAVLADSVGRALLVVLDRLGPAERVAFVLHDLFAVPFDQVAPIVERSPVTTKKLASRARRKVRGTAAPPAAELAAQRHVVDAFLAAARGGELGALLAVLAPDVVRRADPAVLPPGVPAEARGARTVAEETVLLGRRARHAAPALVGGAVGAVVAPRGRLELALVFTVAAGRVTSYEVIADPARLAALDVAVLPD